jgi:putative endonuclease
MFRFLQALFRRPGATDAGSRGEMLAAEWLQQHRRFAVVARNWRNPHDRREEIDLVCRDSEVLVFVEVKARAGNALVPGYHAIDRRKKRVLRRAIETYLAQLRDKPNTFRFDVVEVSFGPPAVGTKSPVEARPEARSGAAEPQILHFENVPLFSKHFRA